MSTPLSLSTPNVTAAGIGPTTAASAQPSPPATTPFVTASARRLGSLRWELRWLKTKNPRVTYRIEERLLSLDGAGELQTAWREIAAPKIAVTTDPVTAQISGMNPRQFHMLRVTALDGDRAILWVSSLVALEPTREPPRSRAFWLLASGCTLAAFLVLRWRANRVFA